MHDSDIVEGADIAPDRIDGEADDEASQPVDIDALAADEADPDDDEIGQDEAS